MARSEAEFGDDFEGTKSVRFRKQHFFMIGLILVTKKHQFLNDFFYIFTFVGEGGGGATARRSPCVRH